MRRSGMTHRQKRRSSGFDEPKIAQQRIFVMNRFDFTPYRRSMVGFDRLFDLLEKQAQGSEDKYPPFNIERRGNDAYRITLAVAGFKSGEIDITAQQNLLVVQGRKSEEAASGQFLHVGIAQRAFERRF